MSKSLNAFLNPIPVANTKVVISDRFVEDGKPVEWEIKPLMTEDNEFLMRKHTKRDKKTQIEIMDRNAYLAEMITTCVVFPDLKNTDLQKAYGVLGEQKLLSKMLTAGEYTALSVEIQKLSGFDAEQDTEVVEELKN